VLLRVSWINLLNCKVYKRRDIFVLTTVLGFHLVHLFLVKANPGRMYLLSGSTGISGLQLLIHNKIF